MTLRNITRHHRSAAGRRTDLRGPASPASGQVWFLVVAALVLHRFYSYWSTLL
ncbi:hypothetical protein ACRAJ3_06055 [Rhodococcus pyridinivorans]|uniref:hypothetical protein n=1 Tax=Nocardiaceae TaxID=85025 RepID=UPI001894FDFF|nr:MULTISPECIES: hypothetical protein [Nocardiaceae]QQM55142.1 hypothetical protein JGU70_11225 [Rhodococcus pyridinivorans]